MTRVSQIQLLITVQKKVPLATEPIRFPAVFGSAAASPAAAMFW